MPAKGCDFWYSVLVREREAAVSTQSGNVALKKHDAGGSAFFERSSLVVAGASPCWVNTIIEPRTKTWAAMVSHTDFLCRKGRPGRFMCCASARDQVGVFASKLQPLDF